MNVLSLISSERGVARDDGGGRRRGAFSARRAAVNQNSHDANGENRDAPRRENFPESRRQWIQTICVHDLVLFEFLAIPPTAAQCLEQSRRVGEPARLRLHEVELSLLISLLRVQQCQIASVAHV